MKKLLIIAVALTSVNAFATRARVNALGNSAHLVDTQTVYRNPAHIFNLSGDYVNLETGANTTGDCVSGGGLTACSANANPEGMIVRTMGDTKLGLSLGHQSSNASAWDGGLRSGLLTSMNANTVVPNQQNPLELTYGAKTADMNWAATLVYSSYNNKTATTAGDLEKEASTGIRFGLVKGPWDVSVATGAANTVDIYQTATNVISKYTGTMALGVDVGYWMESVYLTGGLTMAGFKAENINGTELAKYDASEYRVKAVNSMKKDGNELFYSVGLTQSQSKETVADTKINSLTLPVAIGLEVEANSWMTLRGSITQSSIINQAKKETGSTVNYEYAPAANSTTVALGAGLKFNKLTFDGTLSTATTQTVNTSSLLAQAGLTYWF